MGGQTTGRHALHRPSDVLANLRVRIVDQCFEERPPRRIGDLAQRRRAFLAGCIA
jgi:hypothetical protein